ncbi:MAG: hypothetical protein ACYCX4_00440 [Bacillota bacterium]
METILKIKDNGEVEIRHEQNGVTVQKTTTIEAVADLFIEAAMEPPPPEPEKWLRSPVLPPGTICFKQAEKSGIIDLGLEWGPGVLPFQYEGSLFPAVPFPRLVFMFSLHKEHKGKKYVISKVRVSAVKETGMLTPATELFSYPYSHVSGTSMCIGSGPLPKVSEKKLCDLWKMPRVILTIPNGDHHYDSRSNRSGMVLRQLLENVNEKPSFPSEWLVPLSMTLGQLVERGH